MKCSPVDVFAPRHKLDVCQQPWSQQCWNLGYRATKAVSVGFWEPNPICRKGLGTSLLLWDDLSRLDFNQRAKGVKAALRPTGDPCSVPQPPLVGSSQVRCKRGLGTLALQPCPAVSEHAIE